MTAPTGAVVVGYDGSTFSQAAVDWAAAEASRRARPLIVLHAAGHLQSRFAEEGAERARKTASGISVETVANLAGAAAALQQMSMNAALVVVGNRGRGQLAGVLLGSVAFAVAAHARSPVVVVRGSSAELPGPTRPVVVGVDGSEDSNAALDHAADVAADTGAELRVLVAWDYSPIDPWFLANIVDHDVREQAVRAAGREATACAEEAVQRAARRHPRMTVRQVVREGRAEHVLTEASAGVGLVVIGARGRGDLAGLLLGSVSRNVIHRAECPVEIVR